MLSIVCSHEKKHPIVGSHRIEFHCLLPFTIGSFRISYDYYVLMNSSRDGSVQPNYQAVPSIRRQTRFCIRKGAGRGGGRVGGTTARGGDGTTERRNDGAAERRNAERRSGARPLENRWRHPRARGGAEKTTRGAQPTKIERRRPSRGTTKDPRRGAAGIKSSASAQRAASPKRTWLKQQRQLEPLPRPREDLR